MTESLKRPVELLKQSTELLMVLEETKTSFESLKSSDECFKSSAECLYYNTVHAVLISHGTKSRTEIVTLPKDSVSCYWKGNSL